MKCPNCGKEALFVNGKYVCVDCGIEISPEEQAAQSQNDNLEASLSNEAPVSPSASSEVPASDASQAQEPLGVQETPMATPEEVAKPVEETYREELAKPEESSDTADSGVYDFSQPTEGTENPSVQTEASAQPAKEVPVDQPQINEVPKASDNYFNPNSFDMKGEQLQAPEQVETQVPTEEAQPESQDNTNFDAYSTPAGIGANEPMVGELEGATTEAPSADTPVLPVQEQPVTAPLEEAPVPETVTPESAPTTMPEAAQVAEAESSPEVATETPTPEPAKSLDEMLDSTASPASAYGPTPSVDGMRPQAASENEEMPSVSEVFGGNPGTPTPQDFGVPPKPEPKKSNKKLYIIIASVVVGLLVLAGAVFGVVTYLRSRTPETTAPTTLESSEINELASRVATAMEGEQPMTTNFEYGLNYSDIVEYNSIGYWQADSEGDTRLRATIGEKVTEKIYIAEEETTSDLRGEDWVDIAGYKITEVPAFFGIKNKAAIFYTTNIQNITSLGPETIDGASYEKYEIVPTEEIVAESLSVTGTAYGEDGQMQIGATGIKIAVWLDGDNKIHKVLVSGEVSTIAEGVEGIVTVNGVAEYDYSNVVIESPKLSAGGESGDTQVVVSGDAKEEGEASSNDLDTNANVGEEVQVPLDVEEETPVLDDDVLDARG
ncbi:MAG: hypothetical protein PHW75_02565 [Patescibacteria group bacterium]|nr:hypothetical protein [Patescibacteria group bacterium]